MATKFYRSNNSDWNTDANWSSSSGGTADTTFPTGVDDAKFDSNSGNCTLNADAAALSLDFTGYVGTFDQSTTPRAIVATEKPICLKTLFGSNVTLRMIFGVYF